jgi:hypothetical protein
MGSKGPKVHDGEVKAPLDQLPGRRGSSGRRSKRGDLGPIVRHVERFSARTSRQDFSSTVLEVSVSDRRHAPSVSPVVHRTRGPRAAKKASLGRPSLADLPMHYLTDEVLHQAALALRDKYEGGSSFTEDSELRFDEMYELAL